MNVFGLLTGRGNNTLKNKNILPVLGKPLLSYPALACRAVVDVNNLYVSSDDENILNAASKYNYKPIQRPLGISGPEAKHVDAITHAIDIIQLERNCKVDILVVLLANSGTVKAEWIKKAINMIQADNSISAVVPAYIEQDHHPYRAKKLNAEGVLVPYFEFGENFISTNRQELSDNYFLCHNFWVLNISESLETNNGYKPWTFLGKTVKPIIVEDSFDVHTLDDLTRTENWIRENIDDY